MNRFTKLDSALKALPDDAPEKDVAAIHVHAGDFIVAALNLRNGERMEHQDAEKAAAELEHCGKKGWRLPTIQELLSLVDYSRVDPAADPSFFPFLKSYWYWTGTPYAGSAGCAWVVGFGDGGSGWSGRDDDDLALAVRSARQ